VWLRAVDGDDTALAAMAEPVAAHWLMHPVRKNWQVAPGPAVTQIRIWELEADASPPRLSLSFQFTGHRQFADPSLADSSLADSSLAGRSPADPSLAGRIAADPSLAGRIAAEETVLAGLLSLVLQGTGPWPWRLVSGHVQTLDEFLGYTFTSRQETPGEYAERTGSLDPPQAAGPARWFRLTAARALGEGDWRPSLSPLQVVELLGR
jgi:hypothetical protein